MAVEDFGAAGLAVVHHPFSVPPKVAVLPVIRPPAISAEGFQRPDESF